MTKKAHTMKRGIALLVGCLVGIPAVTQAAQERRSPLADAPAIRKRLELRDKRFELGVGLASTVGWDFYNALMLNLRLGFHFNDWLGVSISAGVVNMTPDWRSSFNDKLNGALGSSCRLPANANDPANLKCAGLAGTDKTPTPADAAAGENRLTQVILPQFDVVPFTGKFSLFSKLFMNYDLYVSAGPALIFLGSKGTVNPALECTPGGTTGSTTCKARPYKGMKFGINGGVGMHAFVNNYFALNIEVHNLIFKNNAAGRDVTGNGDVTDYDAQWTYNWMAGLNFMFFLPAHVKVSH